MNIMVSGRIEIIFHATFREVTKKRKIVEPISENCTLGDILIELTKRYGNEFFNIINPQNNKIYNDILILLNGKGIREISERIKDKDTLIFSLPVGGG
jgi:molybdopterin converting factor small subunit